MGIVAVGLVLRLAYLHTILPLELGRPPEVGMDRWLSMHVASAIADGNWLGGWSAAYDSSPGYGYTLGVLYCLSARHWLGPLVVQAMLGALVPLLLYGVGRRLFSWSVGVIAAALAALFGPALFYEGLLTKFSLVPVTVAGLLLALVRARDATRLTWALVAGMALGFFLLLRPNGATVVPIVLAWLAWPVVRAAPRLAVARVAAIVLGTALVLAPMAVRDRVASRIGGGSSLWGIHFYIGNSLDADGTYTPVDGVREDIVGHVVDARRLAEKAEGRTLTPAEVSLFWFRRGLAAMAAHPLRAVVVDARKIWLAFEADESGSFGDEFHEYRRASPVLRLPLLMFGVIAPLGLAGLVASLVRRRGRLLAGFVVAYVISLVPFFVVGRYRLPIAPPMLVLAAVGLEEVALRAPSRPRRVLAAAGAATMVGAALLGATIIQVLVAAVVVYLGVEAVIYLDEVASGACPSVPDAVEHR